MIYSILLPTFLSLVSVAYASNSDCGTGFVVVNSTRVRSGTTPSSTVATGTDCYQCTLGQLECTTTNRDPNAIVATSW